MVLVYEQQADILKNFDMISDCPLILIYQIIMWEHCTLPLVLHHYITFCWSFMVLVLWLWSLLGTFGDLEFVD